MAGAAGRLWINQQKVKVPLAISRDALCAPKRPLPEALATGS